MSEKQVSDHDDRANQLALPCPDCGRADQMVPTLPAFRPPEFCCRRCGVAIPRTASNLVPMPRGVVAALVGDDPKLQDLLAAWDAENEARHAAEAEVTRLTQENDRLKAELEAKRPRFGAVRQPPPFYLEDD